MTKKDEVLQQINNIQTSLMQKEVQHQKLIKDITAASNRIYQAQQAEFILKEQSNAMSHEIDRALKDLKVAMANYAQILTEEEDENSIK